MELNYHKIQIRTASSEDAPLLTSWWNDGTIMAHAGFPLGLGITEEEVLANLGPGSLMLLYDHTPIGEMNYRKTAPLQVEIGIKICESHYQEKGIGKVALSMLIEAMFQMGYRTISLDTNLTNTRAQHVYEALGFRKIRTNHHSWQDQLGQWQSSVEYELTADTFHNYKQEHK